MAYVRVATALVEEKSAACKYAHLRRAGTRAVDPIDLCIATSLPSRRRSTNLGQTLRQALTYEPTSTRTGAVVTPAATSTSANREREERELRRHLDYDPEYAPPGRRPSLMEREERDRHDVRNR
jgi:hypothetical protein